ncbi:hypothetical protein [Cellulophaga sp. L1A9]|uniref:hypothetical protein n=1 Tax=Cellulophaga sp. L1A9 TaxID=2686362 RepID=UPI00131C966A|nr:hypothetical protein [Cellulophaga sp. L1A9]
MKLKKNLGKINKSKLFVFLFILGISVYLLIIFIGYNRFNKNEDDLNQLSESMSGYVQTYINQFGEEDLRDPENLKKMNTWLSKTFIVSEKQKKILNYGFGVKYYEKQNLYLFCLYGADKKESFKNVVTNNNIKKSKELIVSTPSFLKYCSNFSDYDYILFAYYKNGNCSNRKILYRFYQDFLALNDSELNLITDYVQKFKVKNENINIEKRSYTVKNVFFKYDDKKISLLCEKDSNNIELMKIRDDLQNYFNALKLRNFDYGVFPVQVKVYETKL